MTNILFLALISTLLTCSAPLLLAAGLRRLYRVPWWLFLVGCTTFIVSQIVHLPLNSLLGKIGWLNTVTQQDLPIWRNALTLGMTAGLCEELARAAGFAILRRRRSFADVTMMGLGHGGIEAMILGSVLYLGTITSLMPLVGKDLTALGISAEQVSVLTQQMAVFQQPFLLFMPFLERLLAIGIHTFLSILVWQSFRIPARWWGLPLAIIYHAAVDAGLVMLLSTRPDTVLALGLLFLMTVPGGVWAWTQRPRGISARPLQPLTEEWKLYLAAVRKELRFAWRSQRVLVVFGVYALFGLTSPLLAYFTPQIIGSFPEAKQFAALIPTPTATDAMLQYVKNVTQFGFILAVLLGMGAIASEKESGTAVMILSKPLPRWAFVLSKFTAQVLVYLGAYIITALGAAYYTWYLFGKLDVILFIALNSLLFVWLLPYVALALLGSALGKTSGVAAGIGLAGAILLLSAQALPRYGILAPGALINWAQMLGTGGDPLQAAAAGGAALGVAIIVILLSSLSAVAAFEMEELN